MGLGKPKGGENMSIERRIKIELEPHEEFAVVRKWARKYPKALEILLRNPNANCPFPVECVHFPCDSLSCNADCLSNGRPFKSS